MTVYIVIEHGAYGSGSIAAVCATPADVDAWALGVRTDIGHHVKSDEWFICGVHPHPGYDQVFGWYPSQEEARNALLDPQTILAKFRVEEWDVKKEM
jgi:hypothetical protein